MFERQRRQKKARNNITGPHTTRRLQTPSSFRFRWNTWRSTRPDNCVPLVEYCVRSHFYYDPLRAFAVRKKLGNAYFGQSQYFLVYLMSGALNVFPGCRWMALLVQSCGNARRRAAHEPFTRPKKHNMPFLMEESFSSTKRRC